MIAKMQKLIHANSCRALCVLAIAVLLSACASYDSRLNSSTTQYLGANGSIITRASTAPLAERVSYWAGDSSSGSPSIVINIPDQKVYYYKGGKLVGISACSTGREGPDSPVGHFRVQLKEKEHASGCTRDFVQACQIHTVAFAFRIRWPRYSLRSLPWVHLSRLLNKN